MNRIHLYFKVPPQKDRYLPGDRYVLALARKMFRRKRISGIKKVFNNLCKGFNEMGISYDINLPFCKIKANEPVVVLGVGKYALQGYKQPNPIIAGIGLMTHPAEWPGLFDDYPVARYLQHSKWANRAYCNYYGNDKCGLWPAGIDTDHWSPDHKVKKTTDFLIYNKIMWDKDVTNIKLRVPLLHKLNEAGLTYQEIVYGQYKEEDYFNVLQQCHAMIFLCEHESQGFACCEALSMNIPVLAWDQGFCLDPNRFAWNDEVIPATSIPFFDGDCGMSFTDIDDFKDKISGFIFKTRNGSFKPRNYILNNLTLKKSAGIMLDIISSVYPHYTD